MRRRPPQSIQSSRAERIELKRILRDGHTEQRIARRARILLAMSDPDTIVNALDAQVGYTPTGIWYVCRRFETTGLDALYNGDRSGRPRELTALERVQIEQLACCDPMGLGLELTHWSTRSLAAIARERLHRPQLAPSTVSDSAGCGPPAASLAVLEDPPPSMPSSWSGRAVFYGVMSRWNGSIGEKRSFSAWTRSRICKRWSGPDPPSGCAPVRLSGKSSTTPDMGP